ncbi:MAG: arginine repressor [Candidatus Latescibacteria bacterium]|jgi:transcriptional regulator of arginine metabolism|nr:arginine repressor [Candidatus Latescibacterota bacterium]
MNGKRKRHQKILDLIASNQIGTQAALARALDTNGVQVTQSTLSKDIRELGIIKAPGDDGVPRYQAPGTARAFLQGEDLLIRELTDFVVDLDGAGHTLVVKTLTGHAQGVCEAIDQAQWPEAVGTLAGENTIFILCRSASQREALRSRIIDITGEL